MWANADKIEFREGEKGCDTNSNIFVNSDYINVSRLIYFPHTITHSFSSVHRRKKFH